jgi:AbrB family looped-hinge helix DNA binding protein
MPTVSKIQRNFQITIPAEVRKKSHLRVGDIVDFKVTDEGILLKPLETIDRSQAWFWSKEWQEEEKRVQKDFRKGRIKASKNVEEFLRELKEREG